MDDRLVKVEQSLDELQKGIADIGSKIEKSFRWSIITMVISMIITWFGIFLLFARGATLTRRSLLG
jgi:hypothetical protein